MLTRSRVWSLSGRQLAALALILGSLAAPARADYLYGVTDGGGSLFKLDPTTGATVEVIPSTGTGGANEDIVPDGQGNFLMSAYLPGTAIAAWELFHLNATTGAATPIGAIQSAPDRAYWVEGLAWVNGVLYGSAAPFNPLTGTYYGYAPDTSDTLIRIDPTTGHATEVGAFGPQFLNVESIAYSPTYGLIGSDIGTLNPDPSQPNGPFSSFHTTPALIQIDPLTGAATKIADMPTGPLVTRGTVTTPLGPFVAGLRFSPDGQTLYGSTIQTHFGGDASLPNGNTSGLVTINPTTGALTELSRVNTPGLDGLAFLTAVPEPGSVVLLAVGGLGLLGAAGLGRLRTTAAAG